jgi:hypothetical protein
MISALRGRMECAARSSSDEQIRNAMDAISKGKGRFPIGRSVYNQNSSVMRQVKVCPGELKREGDRCS